MGLTLEDVESAISMRAELVARSVSFEDVVDFMESVKKSRVNLSQLPHAHYAAFET
jgi:hypothetical protein